MKKVNGLVDCYFMKDHPLYKSYAFSFKGINVLRNDFDVVGMTLKEE